METVHALRFGPLWLYSAFSWQCTHVVQPRYPVLVKKQKGKKMNDQWSRGISPNLGEIPFVCHISAAQPRSKRCTKVLVLYVFYWMFLYNVLWQIYVIPTCFAKNDSQTGLILVLGGRGGPLRSAQEPLDLKFTNWEKFLAILMLWLFSLRLKLVCYYFILFEM